MAYSIREWRERYEVSDKGHPARQDDNLRRGPLEYIRAPVHGKNWSQSYREFNRILGADAPAAYGLFCKLRELQAENPSQFRDCIRDHKGREMGAAEIAGVLGWPEKQVAKLLEVLSSEEVGWVACVRDPDQDHNHNNTTQASRKLPENPGSSGNSRQKRESEYSPEFLEFFSLYPNKDAKKDAFKAFEQIDGYSHMEAIKEALAWQVKQEKWTKDNGKYVPLPATYLRGKRWEDERQKIVAATDLKKPHLDPRDPMYRELMELMQ